jgi:hypothetical protein
VLCSHDVLSGVGSDILNMFNIPDPTPDPDIVFTMVQSGGLSAPSSEHHTARFWAIIYMWKEPGIYVGVPVHSVARLQAASQTKPPQPCNLASKGIFVCLDVITPVQNNSSVLK